jgi:hypothetical protein
MPIDATVGSVGAATDRYLESKSAQHGYQLEKAMVIGSVP